jgi:hypothetical protein
LGVGPAISQLESGGIARESDLLQCRAGGIALGNELDACEGNNEGVAVVDGMLGESEGDTLGGIAKKVGISLKAIQELNPDVNANRMQIGQKLKTK